MASSANYRAPYPRNRKVALARDRYVCHWCGGYANTADHVTPIAEGGTHDVANLVAACQACNSRRSLEWVRANRAWGHGPASVAARAASRPSWQRARSGAPSGPSGALAVPGSPSGREASRPLTTPHSEGADDATT